MTNAKVYAKLLAKQILYMLRVNLFKKQANLVSLRLLNKLKENEASLSGWVIDHENDVKENSEKYKSSVLFYLKNGFKVYPGSRLETLILSAGKISWHRNFAT